MHAQQLVDGFLLHRRASGCSGKTLRWHESALTLYVRWLEDNDHPLQAEAWTPFLLRSYVVDLQTRTSKHGKPLSGYSVTSYVTSLLAFLRWLHEEELTATNLASKVKKPRQPDTIKEAYSDAEVKRLLKASLTTAQGLRDHAMLCVLLDCGLRAAELVNLSTDDVMLDQQLLIVRSGKGKKDRIVPFSFQTAKALSRYLLKARKLDTPCVSSANSPKGCQGDSAALFVSERGGNLRPNSVRLLIERLAPKAGVDGATVHRFRRTFATMYLRNSGDLVTLQKLMGHASLSTTSVYLHITADDLKRSHEASSPLARLLTR